MTQKRFEQFGVLGQVQSQNWTVDQSADKFQNGLGHLRTGRELQNVSKSWNGKTHIYKIILCLQNMMNKKYQQVQ